ncbi:hypothetical protein FB107DRAFT_221616 [Schizophyllum commune]
MADRDNQDVPSARKRPSKKGRGKRRRLESTPAEDGDRSQHASDGDSSSSDATNSAVVSELEKAGRKMFVTCAPWFPKNLLEAVPDADFAVGDRFESEEQKREGLLHDALACIPDHLRDKVHQWQSLRTAFMYGLDTLRRGTRTRLRTEIDSAIVVLVSDQVDGTLTTADFGKPNKRFEKLRHLIGYKEEKETYDIWDVPVLHKNWEARMSMESREHLFLNRLPMTARWVLSCDENLQKVGQRTKINYMDVYEEYLEKLVIGRERKQKSILNVFRTWDAEFFPYSSRSAGAANGPDRGEVAEQSRRVADILAADDEESQGVVDPNGDEQDA